MIRAVIFDMDGTILDTEKYLVEYWVRAGHACGIEEMTREDGLLLRSFASEYAAPFMREKYGEKFDYQKIRRKRVELIKEANLPIEKKPGVDEILEELKSRGIQTAVATSSNPERTKSLLETVGLYEKFSHIVCATTVEHGKPMPDVYLYACRELGEKPENCMAVEDSPNGVMAAHRAGCRTIMVPDLTRPDAELMKYLDGVAESLPEILNFTGPEKIRLRIVCRGDVQGVGFRYRASHAASSLGVTGFVKNEWDGSVVMEVESDPDTIREMYRRILSSRYIRVTDVFWEKLPLKKDSGFHTF